MVPSIAMTSGAHDPISLLAQEVANDPPRPRLEAFVAMLAGLADPRFNSDGIPLARLVEHQPDRVRIAGNVWDITPMRHAFWLELERRYGEVRWSFRFDAVPGSRSPRRLDTVAEAIDHADQVEWRVLVTGSARRGPDGSIEVGATTE